MLKGGIALRLTRGLTRHSTDLDFDFGRKVDIGQHIRRCIESAGAEILFLNNSKDTDTVQRFKVHFWNVTTKVSALLKIETSFRNLSEDSQVEIVTGIRTCRIGCIIGLKIDAMIARTQARDLYDLEYLVRMYGIISHQTRYRQ